MAAAAAARPREARLPLLALGPLLAGCAVLARGTADPFGATWASLPNGPSFALRAWLPPITCPAR